MSEAPGPQRPLLRVVQLLGGQPTAEELAALLAVLAVRGTTAVESPTTRSAWTDRSRLLRRPLAPGPGAWRASALPS